MSTQVIHKYELQDALTEMVLPPDATVLHVGLDSRRSRCVWVQHSAVAGGRGITAQFIVMPTGTEFDFSGLDVSFVGTINEDPFIWHVFARGLSR